MADFVGEERQHVIKPVEAPRAIEFQPVRGGFTRSRGSYAAPKSSLSGSTHTASIWAYAVMPAVLVGLIWLIFGVLGFGPAIEFRVAVVLVAVVIYLLLAISDSRALTSDGHGIGVTPALALIPIAYLLARAIKLGRSAVGPLVAWVIIHVAAIAVLVVLLQPLALSFVSDIYTAPTPAAPIAAAPVALKEITPAERVAQLTPVGMAASVKQQMISQKIGAVKSVTCPPATSTNDGSQVTCAATLKGGFTINVVVMVDSTYKFGAVQIVSAAPGN